MNEKSELLNESDVITLNNEEDKLMIRHHTFLLHEFNFQLISLIKNRTGGDVEKWLEDGVEAEVLSASKASKGWRKGKVKLTIEFCPDEPESLLDEFRQQ